ncbi:MAG TPA: tyrosine-type recombinase/integrase [Candidatus Limiplasma sp.]|nr:tyrosine-type recombinase/integrase [Candidatus Limiplasma sp.]HPS80472.1 tyrosine-type recombinase/integrase [Candidatus Limiplasma sp.]
MVETTQSSVYGMQFSGLMNNIFDNKNNNDYNNMVSLLGKAYLAGINAQAGYTPNLDNSISQIYPTDTLLMEGESSMAKQRKERVQIGMDIQGKPIYAFATGTSPQKLHRSIAMLLLENGALGLSNQPSNSANQTLQTKTIPSFYTYAKDWYETFKIPLFKPSTLAARNSLMKNHIYPAFGTRRLNEIHCEDIQKMYTKKAEGNMAKSSIDLMKTFLRQIFDAAQQDNYISSNPARDKRVKNPSKKTSYRWALREDQVSSIINSLDLLERNEKLFLALLIYTGMRKGEILGLKWEDIDENGINVVRNATYPSNTPEVVPPKTRAGTRRIPIVPELYSILQESKSSGWLFGNRWDEPIYDQDYKRMFENIQNSIDLFGATPHIFRHTFITILAQSNMSVKLLQYIAGHENIATTLRIYAHVSEKQLHEAVFQMEEILNFTPPPKCDKVLPFKLRAK